MSEPKRTLFLTRNRVLFVLVLLVSAYIAVDFWPTLLGRAAMREDERVAWFPTVGQLSESGSEWTIPIHGWVFEPETDDTIRNAAITAAQESLGIDDAAEKIHLQRRLQCFLVDSERGKEIEIKIGIRRFALPSTGANGHVDGEITYPADLANNAATLRFETVLPKGDKRKFPGLVHLLPKRGLSVISDIDDTIKITDVTDKRKLVRRTFLEPFAAVPGMAELYRRFEKENGARFHFVSGSPWQLYGELAAFTEKAGFPAASFHLRTVRIKDPIALSRVIDPIEFKSGLIAPFCERFPERKFVLVGDSGEKDPEVYGAIARRFPKQVVRIFIRDVTGEGRDAKRYRDAMRGVVAEMWEVFREPSALRLPE